MTSPELTNASKPNVDRPVALHAAVRSLTVLSARRKVNRYVVATGSEEAGRTVQEGAGGCGATQTPTDAG